MAQVTGLISGRSWFPISRTAIITAALFSFLAGWGDFLFALTLTNSAQLTPITVGIYR